MKVGVGIKALKEEKYFMLRWKEIDNSGKERLSLILFVFPILPLIRERERGRVCRDLSNFQPIE